MDLQNLPLHHSGSSLQAQIKRKDKEQQTKYAHVKHGSVRWEEILSFDTSLFTSDAGKTFDAKTFTIRIKSLTSDNYLMEFDLNVADFVKNNSRIEAEHTIVFPPDFCFDESDVGINYGGNSASMYSEDPKRKASSSTSRNVIDNTPKMNLVIRSYAEGINRDRGTDFSQFHAADNFINPLAKSGDSSVKKLESTNKTYSFVQEQDIVEEDNAPNGGNKSKERRGTRKISVMWNDFQNVDGTATTRGSVLPHERQRPSTFRFSIAAANRSHFDDSDDDMPKSNNHFSFGGNTCGNDDDDDDPFGEGFGNNGNKKRSNRLLSTANTNHFGDIGEDSDY